jgi:hypothetical protein
VFPSLLGPVYPLDIHTANSILSESVADADGIHGNRASMNEGKSWRAASSVTRKLSAGVGHPTAVVQDLQTAYRLVQKICARATWLDAALRQPEGDDRNTGLRYDARRGRVQRAEGAASSLSHRLVNALLSLYAAAALEFCTSAEMNKKMALPVPIVWENRDK